MAQSVKHQTIHLRVYTVSIMIEINILYACVCLGGYD